MLKFKVATKYFKTFKTSKKTEKKPDRFRLRSRVIPTKLTCESSRAAFIKQDVLNGVNKVF